MKNGFTLLELIIVIIIIGVLASIALPRYQRVAERARTAEALAVLSAARSSQLRYATQYGGYGYCEGSVTPCSGVLDIEIPPMKYFRDFAAKNTVNDTGWFVRVGRNESISFPAGWRRYNLCISADGTIYCMDASAAEGGEPSCQKLGYVNSPSECWWGP